MVDGASPVGCPSVSNHFGKSFVNVQRGMTLLPAPVSTLHLRVASQHFPISTFSVPRGVLQQLPHSCYGIRVVMVIGTGSRSTGNGSRSLRVWHSQGGCHRPVTWCTGRMGHGATRDNVKFQKWPLGGIVTILAMVVPPTVSLGVPRVLPGSHLASVQIWSQNSY